MSECGKTDLEATVEEFGAPAKLRHEDLQMNVMSHSQPRFCSNMALNVLNTNLLVNAFRIFTSNAVEAKQTEI